MPTPRRTLVSLLVFGLAGALTLSSLTAAAAVQTDPNDGVPRTATPVTYDRFEPVADPGAGAGDYLQPFWYDTDGRHIQAHGGQVVTVQEQGQTVYYWYGEDRTNGYWNSPGVGVYRSTDGMNWQNLGTALRTVTSPSQLEDSYFDALYDTVDDQGVARADRIAELAYHLDTNQSSASTAIVERPKVLYNAATGKWVMWWHADGRTEPGGSTYARSFAAVAVADSPAGPFRLTGAFRLYNRADYTACTRWAVPGQARDMTVFQDADGSAYIAYSSEENQSLYIARLNADYTNVEHTTTTDTLGVHQYSEDGRYPYVFADGTAGAPVRGVDFQIVRECGSLEAPAIFAHGGRYYVVASGATGWAPNQQTYYTAPSLLGSFIRGVVAGDAYENVGYWQIPEGGDGRLASGDTRGTTFGSQSTNVLDFGGGRYVYMGDRWNEGKSDSTYVWLPLTFGENGSVQLRNPAAVDPGRWGTGWDLSYWDTAGAGTGTWSVADDRLPASVARGSDAAAVLPAAVSVSTGSQTADVPVTWSTLDTSYLGTRTITGTLAADAAFTEGRRFTRTVSVVANGLVNVAPAATVTASSRADLVPSLTDGNLAAKGWDDWSSSGYPRDSSLSFSWPQAQQTDSIVVHTFKDGATATWPSEVQVQVQDSGGRWVASGVQATVSQSAAQDAPVIVLDTSQLAATAAMRLRLVSAENTWQSISEVQVWGVAPPTNVCTVSGATVSASFSQTEWATLPASNACDGNTATPWSTWTGGTQKDSVTFTLETPAAYRLDRATFTNTEGSITSVGAEYRDQAGRWLPTSATSSAAVTNGTATTLSFAPVTATGLRLTFQTPGSYLKIPEIVVPEAPAPVTVTPEVRSDTPAGDAGWFRSAVSVGFTADAADATVQYRVGDDGAWTDATGPVTVSTDGATPLSYRAVRGGVVSAGSEGRLVVSMDATAPVTTASTDPASGTAPAGGTVTVRFASTDATSGVAYTEYSLDGGATWARATGDAVSFTETGSHVVGYRSVDLAGNVEATRQVTATVASATVARATVTSADTPTADGWYQQSVLVRLEAPSAGQRIQYRLNGGAWRSYTTSLTVSTNGTTTLEHRLLVSSAVVAGSTAQVVLKVDRTLPVGTVARTPSGGVGTPRNPISVVFGGTDATSGVQSVEYRLNSGAWTTAGDQPVVFGTVGDWVVSYRVTDRAGNVSQTKSISVVVVADPVTAVSANPSTTKAGANITVGLAGFLRWDDVTVTIGGTVVATVMTDANGAARVTVKVPASTAPGTVPIVATGSDPSVTATKALTVKR